MNDNENNYSWREWSKYVLLTLERFEKLIESLRLEITTLKEKVENIKSEIESLEDEISNKASKSDLKLIDFKVALVTGVITFAVTLIATYIFNLITGNIPVK